jgi:acyl carrier protein
MAATNLTLNASFTKDPGAGFLDLFEIVVKTEKEFNIIFPAEDAEKLLTVEKLIN